MASFPPEGPPRARRRRMALALGLSLAVHATGVGLLLTWVVRPVARGSGEEPGDYINVLPGGDVDPGEVAGGGPTETGGGAAIAPAERAAQATPPAQPPSPLQPPPRKPAAQPRPRPAPAPPARAQPAAAPRTVASGPGVGTSGATPDAGTSSTTPRAGAAGATPGPGTSAAGPAPPDAGIPAPSAGASKDQRADPGYAARAAFRATLRRHMREAWQAYEVYQRIDPHRRLQGSLFTTSIEVRLRPDGSIARTQLAASSGVKELDAEALAALGRMQPLPPLPPVMIDAEGGWTVRCMFHFDVGLLIFAARLRLAIAEIWRPSRAFAMTAEQERTTVVKLRLARDGKLIAAEVAVPSGLPLLDDNARRALPPGTVLPPPPPAFTRQPGPAHVMVAFLHRRGEVRMLKPREDIDEE
jgi:TonB family protein